MAVVFISPKHKQRVFFTGITVAFLLALLVLSFGVFLSKPRQIIPAQIFNAPKVSINMDVFGSDQFKKLLPFGEMEVQYLYEATDGEENKQTGIISAISTEEARKILEGIDLTVNKLEEADVGRENPFVPYYQITPLAGPSPAPRR